MEFRRKTHAIDKRVSGISYTGNFNKAASLKDALDVDPS